MRENFDNKSLVKVEDNIFLKIKNWFTGLFKVRIKNVQDIVDSANSNIDTNKTNNKEDFLNSLKTVDNEDTNIFNLQMKYENGQLKVSEMSENEYSKIEDLYNKQIENLTNQIKQKKLNYQLVKIQEKLENTE